MRATEEQMPQNTLQLLQPITDTDLKTATTKTKLFSQDSTRR
jgi:hypothetical protein